MPAGAPIPASLTHVGLVESFYPQATGARALPANRGDKGELQEETEFLNGVILTPQDMLVNV